jgi:hypothetical protein
MAKRLLILGALLAVAAISGVLVIARPHRTRPRLDCGPVIATSNGAYKHLARVDVDGYVLPFAELKVDATSRWEIEIDDLWLGKLRVADRDLIARFQKMRFGCTGTDTGTPETEVRVYRDGAVVYATAMQLGDGLQNQEVGFVEAESKVAFWWMFLASPSRWRSSAAGTSGR